MPEYVLVFKRNDVPSLTFEGFIRDTKLLSVILSRVTFMERDKVENDHTFKQLISYSLLRHDKSVLHYKRAHTIREARLQGLYSIGWGGHVNSMDNVLPLWKDAIVKQTLVRELQEEINVDAFQPRLLGFINDDSNSVGQVHLGVVYECWLEEPKFGRRYKQGHRQTSFISLDDLAQSIEEYERWSQILISEYLTA
jgi:predicted NUDIX family phosphoesterase